MLGKLLDTYFGGSTGSFLGFHIRTAGLDAAQAGQLVARLISNLRPLPRRQSCYGG